MRFWGTNKNNNLANIAILAPERSCVGSDRFIFDWGGVALGIKRIGYLMTWK